MVITTNVIIPTGLRAKKC